MIRNACRIVCLSALLAIWPTLSAQAAGGLDVPWPGMLYLWMLMLTPPFLLGMALSRLRLRWLTALFAVLWGAGWLLVVSLEGAGRSMEHIGAIVVFFAVATLPLALGWMAARAIKRARHTAKPAVTHGL